MSKILMEERHKNDMNTSTYFEVIQKLQNYNFIEDFQQPSIPRENVVIAVSVEKTITLSVFLEQPIKTNRV